MFILISCLFFSDYISICPKLTHVACTSAVKYPVCVWYNQICDYYPNCPGGEDESDCLSYNRCDFQKDMCDWITAKHTLFEWERYYDSSMYQYCFATRINSCSTLYCDTLRGSHALQFFYTSNYLFHKEILFFIENYFPISLNCVYLCNLLASSTSMILINNFNNEGPLDVRDLKLFKK